MKKFLVSAQRDGEASVWVATSDDIPGLVTEAPELLEDNAHLIELSGQPGDTIDLSIESRFRLDGARAH